MKQNLSRSKMSAILSRYASGYIGMGVTLEAKQLYLESAILAWNLSLLPEGERERQLEASIRKLESLNPGSKDIESLKHNLAILIERKVTEFADIKKLVLNAQISIVDGRETLTVVSTDFHDAND